MAQPTGGNPFGPRVGQEAGLSKVKRERKQAFRALHRKIRSLQASMQKIYRDSQKIAGQPSMITAGQFEGFVRKLNTVELQFSAMQSDLKVVANVIGLFF